VDAKIRDVMRLEEDEEPPAKIRTKNYAILIKNHFLFRKKIHQIPEALPISSAALLLLLKTKKKTKEIQEQKTAQPQFFFHPILLLLFFSHLSLFIRSIHKSSSFFTFFLEIRP